MFQTSILKSPTLQLTSARTLPVTRKRLAATAFSPPPSSSTTNSHRLQLVPPTTSSSSSSRVKVTPSSTYASPRVQPVSSRAHTLPSPTSPTTSTTTSSSSSSSTSRQQPVALDPYHLKDVEVQLKPGCHDIMLRGKVGVVIRVSGKMATVQIRENSSDITVPHESLVPAPVRVSDTVKVIGGADSILGFVGTLVSRVGTDGIVQFISVNNQRRRNSAQVPLAQLGRYTPRSKFPSGPPLSLNLFPQRSAERGGGGGSVVSTAASTLVGSSTANQTQYMVPLDLFAAAAAAAAAAGTVPSSREPTVCSLGPFFATSTPPSSSSSLFSGLSFPPPSSSSSSTSTTRLSMAPFSGVGVRGSGKSASVPNRKEGTNFFNFFGGRGDIVSRGGGGGGRSVSDGDKRDVPDSTTSVSDGGTLGRVERDSASQKTTTPHPARSPVLQGGDTLFRAASSSQGKSEHSSRRHYQQQSSSAPPPPPVSSRPVQQHQAVDRPTGQIFPFPISMNNFPGLNRNQQRFFFFPGRMVPPSGGEGGGGMEGGKGIKEVLERLVRDQRDYTFDLASPSTPGGCGFCLAN